MTETRETMLERAARAGIENLRSQKAYVNVGFKWLDANNTREDLTDVCVDSDSVDMLAFTKAVLEAIRKPDEAMFDAPFEAGIDFGPGGTGDIQAGPENVWQAMIDTILKQE